MWHRSLQLLRSPMMPVIIEPCRLHVLALVEQLRTVLMVIDRFDTEIERVASALPDYALFHSLPGTGQHLAPRLLAAFGEQRERFHGAGDLQKYSGMAPVTERSGKKSWVHWRWLGPTFLRQTFVEGQVRPSTSLSGLGPISGSSVPKEAVTRLLYAHLRSSEFGFCTGAGRSGRLMMKSPI
ncbi:transposase [Pseudomonas guariconensis]|uniref:transposase n=1 Tax=Pseudomonas guariconensis TaxID=1288410 RepID=UPI002E1CFEA2